MLILVCCALLCACANGLAGGENKVAPSPLVYETYADAGRYLFDPAPQNWTDASKVCRAYNGHLAFPKTQDEADALWSIMTRYNVKQVHAGFHDQFLEGEYYTAKGRLMSETSFNKWSVGAPIGGSSLNCGGLRSDGLVDVACKDILPSICEENGPSTPDGFLDYIHIEGHGHYKLFSSEFVLWPVAMRDCYDQGAHLWIVNSEKERAVVFERLKISYDVAGVWVGVHQLHAEGYFVTVFDDALESTGYTQWSGTSPGGPSYDYRYVSITGVGLAIGKLGRHYVCEYNPVTQSRQ